MAKLFLQSVKFRFINMNFFLKLLVFLGILFLALVLQYSWEKLNWVITTVFLERDLERARALTKGYFIFFGPEITGGGNLPGPFFYFLLTPPFLLGLGFIGGYYWMCILMALGGVAGWYFFRSRFDTLTAFLWLILYSMLFPVQFLISKFLNPSFSPLFIVLINIFLLKAFTDDDESKRGRSFILACLSLGLAIQIHYSSLVYIFAFIILRVFAKKFGLPSFSRRNFYLGLAAFLLTLTPFFVWIGLKKLGIEIGQENPYDGVISNSLPSLFDHFKTTWDVSITEFLKLALMKIFTVAPVLILLVLVFTDRIIKDAEKSSELIQSNVNYAVISKVLGVCLLLTFLPFSFYFFVPQGSRYGAPLALSSIFLVAVLWRKILNSLAALKLYNALSLAAFILSLAGIFILREYKLGSYEQHIFGFGLILFVSFFYIKRAQKNNSRIILSFVLTGSLAITGNFLQWGYSALIHQEVNSPRYWIWMEILPEIQKQTGWTYVEAVERIYFINIYREQSFRSIYKDIETRKPEIRGKIPDGYFIGIDKSKTLSTLNWILEQPIAEDVRDGLLSGNIIIGEHKNDLKFFYAPYYVINKSLFTPNFHNVGWGYNALTEEKLLRDFTEAKGIKKISAEQYLFKWNECPNQNYYCDTAAIVNIKSENPGVNKFEVIVVGLPLSQNTKWINPTWTES